MFCFIDFKYTNYFHHHHCHHLSMVFINIVLGTKTDTKVPEMMQ